jgi:phosphopantetheinyl transferase (holo-ACP synthase)
MSARCKHTQTPVEGVLDDAVIDDVHTTPISQALHRYRQKAQVVHEVLANDAGLVFSAKEAISKAIPSSCCERLSTCARRTVVSRFSC